MVKAQALTSMAIPAVFLFNICFFYQNVLLTLTMKNLFSQNFVIKIIFGFL